MSGLSAGASSSGSPALARLSPHQLEYLVNRASGLTNEAIAIDRGVSLNAVKQMGTRTYRKLDVSGIVDALRVVGWLTVPRLPELFRDR